MAQIIKHRRGGIDAIASATAKKGELVMATGSVGQLNGPFIFIGETDGAAGGFRSVSKIYQGSTAPDLSNNNWGTTLNGTPFYSSDDDTLYILGNGGNTAIDLTGNIEGNVISGVTINNLESTNVSASFFTGSFVGDGSNLVNIPASGVTGLDLSQIASGAFTASISDLGGFRVNTDAAITGTVYIGDNTASQIYNDGALYVQDNNNGVTIQSNNYAELQTTNAWVWVEGNNAYVEGGNYTKIYTDSGSVDISSYNGGNLNLNNDAGEGDINIGNSNNNLYGNTVITDLSASDYAQLNSNNSFLFVNSNGAHVQNNSGTLSGVTARSNGEVEVTGSLSVGGGNFIVDGATGDIRTSGSITMKGNITIGDNMTGDTININGEISSSIIPSGSGIFDLGSSGNTWGDIYVGTVHADNINLNTISFSGLTEGRAVFVGASGSLKDDTSFTFDSGSGYLSAPIINATSEGNGTNFKVGNDVWIGDVNQANTMMFKGVDDEYYTKVLLNNNSSNNYLEANYSNVKLSSNNSLYLQSQNDSVNIDAYDGNLYLNNDSNNNVTIGGHTYINNRNLYVNKVFDNNNTNNYLELYGWNTNDGYWWESGNGSDTTLLNNENNNNLNILQTNNGNVNIDATNGSVNLHSANGFNVTGSMIVSDASGVFNSSLVANNSNLTLNNGSNLDIQDGGTLTVNGNGNFNNNVYVTGNTYTDNYRGMSNTDNALHMNGGTFGAPGVELVSSGQISLFAEGNGNSGIHLTGSVYSNNDVIIDNNNSLRTNNVYGAYDNNLNLYAWQDVYIYSQNSRYVEISANNDESGTNYLWVQHEGVGFQTYDYTSELNHTVFLDNTGSLKLTNVNVQISGSLGVDGNTTYNNDLTVGGDLYVSGNFTVLGTGSIITLSGSQVDIGTNKILLNTYSPFERFAGIDVYDSGSNAGVTGSLLWDSQNNVWLYANPSGSNYASARFIAGPKNTGSLGEETGLTNGHFPIATGDDHISDSLLTYQGTTLALNTNKFTVDSDSGDTLISGNFTIEGLGGVDNGNYTSYIVFRNNDDVLGFVDTQDTQNITDRLLGYNSSTGVLEFSSLIDGGTY